ncbi:MAG: YbjN domain-containing protein [Limnothrix sp. RL_2_0]|nr:YbjN domain-containing protein [Limnothrix sp. RL_2_0]
MTPEAISQALQDFFPEAQVVPTENKTWKVHQPEARFHLLASLSKDHKLLRIFVPIAPQSEAEPYFPQLLEHNFSENKLVRYSLNQNLLWAAFKYPIESLDEIVFEQALDELQKLHQQNLNPFFNQLAEDKVREIVTAAKAQGQTMEMTMQTITRFYEEGIMGGLDQEPRQRQKALLAWQYQLQQLWEEEDL